MIIFDCNNFSGWTALNDTIMGGNSTAICIPDSNGLLLSGMVVKEGGGFVSCRSPIFQPPLNLKKFSGLEINLEARGVVLKIALSCYPAILNPLKFIQSKKIRWTMVFETNESGISKIQIPFRKLHPVIRAKPITTSLKFNASRINQFQILYSRFDQNGNAISDFKSGPVHILLRSINAYE